MPIYLPPLSRREFLKRTLAAGAAFGLGPLVEAAPAPVDESFWALLSDVHVAADPARIERGVNMANHFQIVSKEILALPKRPGGLVINGDCALASGQSDDYVELAQLLAPLRAGAMPIHLTLGNHDQREHFWRAFPRERAMQPAVPDRQVALVSTRHVNWFILDSLEKTSSTPGLLGREQLSWLRGALDANAHKPALILVHHNPGIGGGNFGLKDTIALLEVLRPRQHVKAYIFGHTHHWEVQQDPSGLHLVNLPAVAYVFREGEPSGWVRATLAPEGMRLELRCVDQKHPAHGQVHDLNWRT